MYQRVIIIGILLLFASPVNGAVLKGVILANELSGPPISNVQIGAVAGANLTATDANGKFTLKFPYKQPGEIIQLVVRKPGYVVVNDVQLHWTLPKDADAEPLILLLCKPAARDEMAARFYRLKEYGAIDDTYRRRMKELETINQATLTEKTKLSKERDQAKAVADEAVERLARLRPGQASELHSEALSLLLRGKAEEALNILDEEKLRRSGEAARKRKDEAKKEIAQVIQTYLFKAQLLTTQFRFDEAGNTLRAAVDLNPESFTAQFALAYFLQRQNHHRQALSAYLSALQLARRSGNKAREAQTLINLGILYDVQNQMDESQRAYLEALTIYRQLAKQDSEKHLPSVAFTLNNIGMLRTHQTMNDEAQRAFEEALTIYRQLAKKNPEKYVPNMMKTLMNIGIVYEQQNRVDKAEEVFKKAIISFRQLAKKNSEEYSEYVAMAIYNLGKLYLTQSRKDEAQRAFEEALTIYRQLAKNNPEKYAPELAYTLWGLATLCEDLHLLDEARQSCEEALAIFRQLAEENPEAYEPYVADVLNNLGYLYVEQNLVDKARQSYSEALEIYENFAKLYPEKYNRKVTSIRGSLKKLERL